MSGGAFIRLNTGGLNLKTGKHTKISVVGLLKILRICRFGRGKCGRDRAVENSVVFAANSVGYG
jgi:hypothetical protein